MGSHLVDTTTVSGRSVVDAVDLEARTIAWAIDDELTLRVRRAAARLGRSSIAVDGDDRLGAEDVVDGDVVVMDRALPDWLGAAARLIGARPGVRVLVVGDVSGPDEFLAALAAGIVGFCPGDASVDAIERSMRSIVRSGVAIPREFARPLVDAVRHGRGRVVSTPGGEVTITEREWEILQLLRQRRTTREISTELFVSVGTVRSHVSALVKKLGAVDRDDAVALVERGRR